MRYDLHLHSYYSDGTLAPEALVTRAHTAGVNVLALTDHDCTAGLHEAAATARALGIHLVPGVEISVTWESQTIHVVGLGIQPDNKTLQAGLATLVERRQTRAQAIAQKLARRRIADAYAGATRLTHGNIIGRLHFARFLVQQEYVPTLAQAFRQFLARGAAAYVSVQWASLEEAVAWINGAGGQAVIAHPKRYELSNTKLRKLLAEFKACGGAGIEVICGGQDPQTNAHSAELAREFELMASTGSDYHGPETPWREPGRLAPLPEICVPVWRDWALV